MSTPQHWFTLSGSAAVLFPFLELKGALIPSALTHDRETRPGVNGIGIWYTGRRGSPFSIQTLCDYPTRSSAMLAFKAHRDQVGNQLDLYYSNGFWGVVVLHSVAFVELRHTGRMIGGVNVANAANGFVLRVAWTIETLHQ